VLVAAASGLAVGLGVGFAYRGAVGPMAGWVAAGVIYNLVIWRTIWPLDAKQTSTHVSSDDPSRRVADGVMLLAAIASLGAVAVLISQSQSAKGALKGTEVGLGVASVAVSWLLVHTLFTLQYARLYYSGDEGGVDFENKVRPPYSDFAYLAFTIGMTFQVSDTDLTHNVFRRTALRHALLSYLFGTGILATTINLVANL
jgi:uncharacterized membrane protein